MESFHMIEIIYVKSGTLRWFRETYRIYKVLAQANITVFNLLSINQADLNKYLLNTGMRSMFTHMQFNDIQFMQKVFTKILVISTMQMSANFMPNVYAIPTVLAISN